NLLKAMTDQFTGYLVKRAALWAENQLAETALGQSFGLVRAANQATESGAVLAAKSTELAAFTGVEGLKLQLSSFGSATRVAGQVAESTAINTAKASEGAVATATEGVKAAASTAGLGVQAATGSSSIMMSAWTGMANAYAAISAIPVVGPVMAPVVAAGVFAAIAALVKNLFSAEGGFDIPAGINPLTQLHEREMVLPKEHADTIRSLERRGGGDTFHLHVNAIDPKGFESWMSTNAHTLAPSLRKIARNAVPVLP
ncbi:MAG: hypothetical protein HQL90_16245, partial [Magnetococcales bacterium]|nr:hypothetical protein [Magnetococcales bacterium]